jgi:hypothetical protein
LEAIVLCLDGEGILHVSPHGAETVRAPWDPDLDPMESIVDVVADLGMVPVMALSTSWRIVERELLLTFLVIVERPDRLLPTHEIERVPRAELARGGPTTAPSAVHLGQVVERGLRHLAWLVAEDDAIHQALGAWSVPLGEYRPAPFRAFDRRG